MKLKMKKIAFLLSIISIFLSSCGIVIAQSDEVLIEQLKQKPLKGIFGLSFTNSVPQNEFYDNLKRSGQGFSLYGGYNFTPVPVTVGLQTDFLFYGGDERIFSYRNQGGWTYLRDTVSYQNMIIPVTILMQVRPNVGEYIFPYFEAFAGFTIFSASSDFKSGLGIEDSKDEISAGWNIGLGAGTMIKLVDFVTLPSFYSRMLLDIKARYVNGTPVQYYMVKQINSDTSPDFRRAKSKTDLVTFQVGLVFEF
jgi:opacity protein-like surface antigen